MKQTITDLPDGTYTLRASVISSGGQNECLLYANTGDKEYTASLKSKMSNWTDIVVKDIVIENGECEIGLYSDALANNYVRIDDLYLTRNYDGTVIDGKPNTNVPVDLENSIVLKDIQGNEITKLNDGDVYAEATYVNQSEQEKKITVYMALYDKDGVLKSVKQKNETAAPQSNGTIKTESISLGDNTDEVYVKLFLWENEMKPLCNSIKID